MYDFNSTEVKSNITGTKEWAARNVNISKGCLHDCKYCYAKAIIVRHHHKTIEGWTDMVLRDPKNYNIPKKKLDKYIMFPSSHDITVDILDASIDTIKRILHGGNKVLIVSKPHLEVIGRLCEELKDQKDNILFRFTFGSADNKVLKFWEPNAPDFEERLSCLKLAFEKGFQTSVSSEPMLDDNIHAVIEKVRPFITESIWLGKANRLKSCLSQNGYKDAETWAAADNLISLQTNDKIWQLYERYKDDKMIKWKDSIKKVIGIDLPEEAGLNI